MSIRCKLFLFGIALAGLVVEGWSSEAMAIQVSGRIEIPLAGYHITTSTPQTAGVGWSETVTAVDTNGATLTGAQNPINLSSTGNAVFYSDATFTTAIQSATLNGGKVVIFIRDTVKEKITLSATDVNGKSGSSDPIQIKPGQGKNLSVAQHPSGGRTGLKLDRQPVVEILDEFGNTAEGEAIISASLGTNPTAARLIGTADVPTVAGTAAFTDLTLDTEGQGFTLIFRVPGMDAVQSAPFDIGPTDVTVQSDPAEKPLALTQVLVRLSFYGGGKDLIRLSGTLPVPAGFDPEGKHLSIAVGGVETDFSLGAKGKSIQSTQKFILRLKKTKGVVNRQDAKWIGLLSQGNFANALADSGMLNETITNKKVEVVVSITMDGTTYTTGSPPDGNPPLILTYTAKEGRIGTAKK